MSTHFFAFGLSYKQTPLSIRGMFSFDETTTKSLLFRCKEQFGISEMMVLSTCNRFEVYYKGDVAQRKQIEQFICMLNNIPYEMATKHFTHFDCQYAIKHLFEVALGLDSKVLGDIQIISQVKKAYQWSCDENMAGPFLHRLLHTVFHANKRVSQETDFAKGTASLASVSTNLIKKFVAKLIDPTVLLIGVGEIGVDVAKNLQKVNSKIKVVNRTHRKAKALANAYQYQVEPFSKIQTLVKEADVIISTIRADEPILDKHNFKQCTSQKLLIDLSVPCSIHQDVHFLPTIQYYNIDHLETETCDTLARRTSEIPKVLTIISQSMEGFNDWTKEMSFSPAIKQFKDLLEEIRKTEMDKYLSKTPELNSAVLDEFTKGFVNKLVRLPVLQLKAACQRGNADEMAIKLKELFDLES